MRRKLGHFANLCASPKNASMQLNGPAQTPVHAYAEALGDTEGGRKGVSPSAPRPTQNDIAENDS